GSRRAGGWLRQGRPVPAGTTGESHGTERRRTTAGRAHGAGCGARATDPSPTHAAEWSASVRQRRRQGAAATRVQVKERDMAKRGAIKVFAVVALASASSVDAQPLKNVTTA